MLAQLVKENPEDVRVIYRHFPLNNHDKAMLAAQATEAAGLQGKFWEMHDEIFAKQAEWSALTPEQFEPWLVEAAKGLKLDTAKFQADLKSEAIVKKVTDAQQKGIEIGLPGTPFMLINGKVWQGPNDLASLKAVIDLLKLEERQFTGCPPMEIDPAKQYTATIKTEKGDIVIQLFADKAPITVNSFVFLARNGWFDNITFHRVLEGFVAQTGDPSGSGFGGPGYFFKDEITPDLNFDKEGMVGMANSGPNTNGSQFFITLAAQPDLSQKYPVFGQVVKGMDVVRKLTPRNPAQNSNLPEGDRIETITIEEK